jgi:hypothetical protein
MYDNIINTFVYQSRLLVLISPGIAGTDSGMFDKLILKVKVKVTLVQALRLCIGHLAHSGSRGIALLFHDQQH